MWFSWCIFFFFFIKIKRIKLENCSWRHFKGNLKPFNSLMDNEQLRQFWAALLTKAERLKLLLGKNWNEHFFQSGIFFFKPFPFLNKHPPFWITFESWGIFHWYQKLTLKLKLFDAKIAIFLWTFFLKWAKKRWNALLCEFKAWESWKIDTADLHVILFHEKDDVPVIRRPNEMTKMTEWTGLTSNSSRNGVKCHD